jgi:outer membrane protein assembly factor BamB
MKYLSIFLLLSASFTYAMEQKIDPTDNPLYQRLSTISFVMKEQHVPLEVITLTQQIFLKLFDANTVFSEFKNKSNTFLALNYKHPRRLPFDGNKIKQATIANDVVFFLSDDGTAYHNLNTRADKERTSKSIMAYTVAFCPGAHPPHVCLFLDPHEHCDNLRVKKFFTERLIKRYAVHQNMLWFSVTEDDAFYQYPLDAAALKRLTITAIPKQSNEELLFTDDHFILYQSTDPGQYSIEVNKITIKGANKILTFKVPGTSLALFPQNVLYTADNNRLYTYNIMTGKPLWAIDQKDIAPQCDSQEPARILCCSENDLIIAKGPRVFQVVINPCEFFAFLTNKPQ